MNRRHFFSRQATGLGALALGQLLGTQNALANTPSAEKGTGRYHFPPRAKRVIYLFQSGGPSQLELFDHKPLLKEHHGQQLPARVRSNQRLTGMSAHQASIPLAGSAFQFQQAGSNGMWLSELLPHTAEIADDLCFVRSMYTEAINHDPAITFLQSGSQLAGRPSFGAWLSYGLGSENDNLPAFVVLISTGQGGQPLYARLWGSGFLDSRYQGVRFRGGKEPVLYLSNPAGIQPHSRAVLLEKLAELNRHQYASELDPEIESRIQQYELAHRMQMSVPEVTDLASESEATVAMYGDDARTPGSYAANCLLARRLVERGVRFVQLYHQGWDQHNGLPGGIRAQARETDQASAALIKDLKQRGLLEDTLVIWGGEFGRTCYSQGKLSATDYGRDHHPRCFTIWLAGGGVKSGYVHGQTDEYGYNVADSDGNAIQPNKHEYNPDAVHVHDLHATLLRLLGVDHEQLAYRYQGRRFRLTDVHGHVIESLIG
ncbi:MAG: DUF1501 domain-containing protein [Pirellulaceae bacterium]